MKALLVPILLLAGSGLARAEPATGDDAARCIDTQRIQSTRVLDDWTVLLRMKGKGPDYVMRLKWRCSQLKFHEYFHYELRGGTEICARLDWITSRSGSACPIEQFEAVARKTDPETLLHRPDKEQGEEK